MVNAIQDIGSVEQGLKKFNLHAFNIDLDYPYIFIENFKKPDEIDLKDLDGRLFRYVVFA